MAFLSPQIRCVHSAMQLAIHMPIRRMFSRSWIKCLSKVLLNPLPVNGVLQWYWRKWKMAVDCCWHLYVDYRCLNGVSETNAYPVPSQAWGMCMALCQGYWKVPVDVASRPKTDSSTPQRLFQLKVMSFGLCEAPITFQKMMVKSTLQPTWMTWISSVILGGAPSPELHASGLTARPKSANLLWLIAWSHGEQWIGETRAHNISSCTRLPCPSHKNKYHGVFLVSLQSYWRFTPTYASSLAAPLTDLTTL